MSDTQLGEYIGFRRYVRFIFKSTMPLYSTTIECENIQNYAYHICLLLSVQDMVAHLRIT